MVPILLILVPILVLVSGGRILRHHVNLPHANYLGMCNRYLATINMPSIEDIKYKGITFNFTPKELTSDLYLPNNSQDILNLYEWGKKVIIYLNPYGDALQIWQDNGKWNWEVKVSPFFGKNRFNLAKKAKSHTSTRQ